MRTLPDLLAARVAQTPSGLAWRVRSGPAWHDLTWSDVDRASLEVAAGLCARGLQRGDRVAIASRTRAAWLEAALGVWRAGGVVVTVYPTVLADEAAFIATDSGATLLIAEDASQRAKVPQVTAVTMEATGGPSLAQLQAEGRTALSRDPAWVARASAALGPDDLAALVYTSGTTGRPKGAMLSHDGFVAVCEATRDHTPLLADDLQYLFLPLAHVYGLVVALVALHVGAPTVLDGDIDRIAEGLQATRPTFLPAVPRVFEKVLEKAAARARARGPRAARVFAWSEAVARQWSEAKRSGRIPWRLALQRRIADRLVYRRVRAALGGRVRALASGGAPLAVEIGAFFHAAGIPVLEGYGLTECTAIATAGRLDAWRLGTVGRPGAGLELRIAEDGEILLRGRGLFRGYWQRPDATAEALVDGWLHTGDIGEVDGDGYLRITDRKKHLIVTSGGKNIAPSRVENLLKAQSALITEVLVHGDRRRYCTALVALDPEAIAGWARAEGHDLPLAELLGHPATKARVMADVAAVNAKLAPYETIKDVVVLPYVPSVEGGELTPSLKLKRKELERRHASELDALYRD